MKQINALMLKLYFVTQICRKCDMFRSILIIFRELLNINFVHKMFIDIIKFFCSSVEMVHNTSMWRL